MGAIKKVTILSIAAVALAGVATKMISGFSRKKMLLKLGKKGVLLYTKWKIAKFIERSILRKGRREPLKGWRKILWYARFNLP
jgi:hypothetical protein